MDQMAHQSNILEAQGHGKTERIHQEASWPKVVANGGAHWSADHNGRLTGGPSHQPPALATRFQEASLGWFGVPYLLVLP